MSSELAVPLTGVLVASACALLGSFLILRRMAMMSDAISHAILPGLVATPLTARFIGNEALYQDYIQRIVLGRAASPEEIAAPTLFLASDEARYVTGTSLVVDGGWEITNYPDLSKYM